MAYEIVFGDAPLQVWVAKADVPQAPSGKGPLPDDYCFCGVLATTARDRQGDAFTPHALDGLAQSINETPLDLIGGDHFTMKQGQRVLEEPGILSTLGAIHLAELRPRADGHQDLYVEGYLFGADPVAGRVYRQMKGGDVHLSVGGTLPRVAKAAYKGVDRDGLPTQFLDAVTPLHALACRKGTAVSPETWTQPIAKAIAETEELAVMPYKSISEIDKSVRDVLPEAAQHIYMGAFNGAEAEGKDEATCHKIAWAAVGDKFKKGSEGKWVEKAVAKAEGGEAGAEDTDAEQPDELSMDALTTFLQTIAKAGARHSGRDIEGLHKIITTVREVCGCGDCTGTVAKAAGIESEDEIMPENDAAQVETPAEVVAEPVAAPVAVAEPVAEATTPEEDPIAKAVAAAMAPYLTKIADLEAKLAEKGSEIAKASVEIAALKALPAGGGPQSKPSGEIAKAEVAAEGEGAKAYDEALANARESTSMKDRIAGQQLIAKANADVITGILTGN